MKQRKILVAGLLVAGLAASAGQAAAAGLMVSPQLSAKSGMLMLAQTDPGQALQLQEQVRDLNGRVEELTFQLLQLQEQLRKMQEDNEFRFQELEGGKRGALPKDDGTAVAQQPTEQQPVDEAPVDQDLADQTAGEIQPGKLQPSEQDAGAQRSDGNTIVELPSLEPQQPRRTIDGVEIYDGPPIQPDPALLQPQTLGTLRFDQNGNVIEAAPGAPVDLSAPVQGSALPLPEGGQVQIDPTTGQTMPPPSNGPVESGPVASLELPSDPSQLYDVGYGYVQAGNYKQAENAFREFATAHPDNPKMGEASFWLGESVFAQGRYEESAKIFLDGHKKYPKSRMGPQNLLKLGVSLAGMNQRELACATFAEVPKKYPTLSNAVRAKVAAEQKAANCSTN